MKNPFLDRIMYLGVDNFTTNFGLKIRRFINPVFRHLLRLGTRRKIIVEQYPKLNKGQPYIFACSHSFDDDVISNLVAIDRSAYSLCGTSEQILHNPKMYANWINGMIFVDRLDPKSRKDSIAKMKRVIESGSSIHMYPEGGWNNTENLLVQPLFAGPYTLNQETGALVVPLATFHEHGAKNIYVRASEPISFEGMSKDEALTTLRDSMATWYYLMIEKYGKSMRTEPISSYHTSERTWEGYIAMHTASVAYYDREIELNGDFYPKHIVRQKDVWEPISKLEINSRNCAHVMYARQLVDRLKREDFQHRF